MTTTLLTLTLTGACGSKDLTRSKAKELIQATPPFQKWTKGILVSEPEELDCLNTSGLIRIGKGRFGEFEVRVAPLGLKSIDRIEASDWAGQGARVRIWFKSPPRPVVDEITGISGSQSEKRVEFLEHYEWNDVGLSPSAVNMCFASHLQKYTDTAVLRLYDDGWRVVAKASE